MLKKLELLNNFLLQVRVNEIKRIFSLLLAVLLIAIIPVDASAVNNNTKIHYLDDGGYIEEVLNISMGRRGGSISGTKTSSKYAADGTLEWQAVLSGTFSYTGSSATCTSSSVRVTIYNTSWYTISKSASRSGNTANATVTMGYKTLGITTNKLTVTPALSCDANGNLS